jgi:UDP-3-O-[3-hydroxymyristoyl] glucosamine N-acyltransferase
MPNATWKVLEREAAALFGGTRYPANSGHRLDFESATAIGQVKLVRNLSLNALTELAEEMERQALPKHKAGVVVVKCRRGKGRASPMLVVVTAAVWEAMNGKASEQEATA